MPSLPLFLPQFQDQGPPPDIAGDFTKSLQNGYMAGRILSGLQAQADATKLEQEKLKIAQVKQAMDQSDQEFPLQLTKLEEYNKSAPVERELAIGKQLLQPGMITNAGTGPRIPTGNSPMALTSRFAAPEGEGQVPADTRELNIPGYLGVGVSPAAAQQRELELENAKTDRLLALVGAKTEGAKEVAKFKSTLSSAANVDPAVLKGMLEQTRKYGTIPSFGLGQSGLRTAYYAALGGADPEAADVLDEGATNKAVRAGQTRAYATQQNLYQGTKTAINTFDKQLNLAQSLSDKVDRTGMPVVNRYLMLLNGKYAGDEDTIAFGNAVQTAANEFARILNGSVASIAGSTVSSVEDAKQLINTALTKGQFDAVANLMRLESGYRLKSYEQTLKELEGSIKDIGSKPKETPSESGNSADEKPRFIIRRKQ